MMKIDPDTIRIIGSGIIRPEGVMVQQDGTVLAADARGHIARIRPDGKTSFYGDVGGTPNGICLDGEGNCIIANIGNGQCQSLQRDGTHTVLMTEANGKKMPTPNFPFVDCKGRLWVSNSSYREDMEDALRHPAPDGCMVLIEAGHARIMAEGIYFANGVALNADESKLYVAATMKRIIYEYTIKTDGSLTTPAVYGPSPLAELGYPDGIAFDEAGNLWVTFPAWNAIGFITPEGELVKVLEDPRGIMLKRPTNICFGWKNRETAFIGSLDGTGIPCFQVPYPGMRLIHQSKD
ncbi:MAG: SMP-30/gluconolactonase/LRE family protein [Deltaproteobacteria bacterium]|nr:SMP-30/gluconolactonase/LRE family protein [Deltaproteobacteria bacterium]